ncbi:MAG TPA: hypothetical protein V6C99_00150 [Oculatellaceae cyanobacterium]|jgi:hypothetical protein
MTVIPKVLKSIQEPVGRFTARAVDTASAKAPSLKEQATKVTDTLDGRLSKSARYLTFKEKTLNNWTKIKNSQVFQKLIGWWTRLKERLARGFQTLNTRLDSYRVKPSTVANTTNNSTS